MPLDGARVRIGHAGWAMPARGAVHCRQVPSRVKEGALMERRVNYYSQGSKISAVLYLPDGAGVDRQTPGG